MLVKIPLPNSVFKSADATALSGGLGAQLNDGFIGELNEIVKRPALTMFKDINVPKFVQGIFWWDKQSILVVVINGRIYKITNNQGDFSDITGATLGTSNKVSFATDGTFLVMANGDKIVHYNNSGTTTVVTDIDAPTQVSHVAFIDGYILALQKNKGVFWYFDVNAFPNITATNFATAESSPDDAVALHVANGEIAIFGRESVEFWFNDGVLPFRVIQQATIQFGCVAPDSIVNISGTYIWFDSNRRVTTIQGRNPVPLSGPFDDEIRDITPVSDAKACWFNMGSRQFYILNFPTGDRTFVIDLKTLKWYEWGTWNSSTATYSELGFNVCDYAKAWDFNLVGGALKGKLFKIDRSVFQDDGATVRTTIKSGHITHGTNNKKRCSKIRIRLKRGAGDITNNEPKMLVRWNNDNRGWGNYKEISLGKMGEDNFFYDIRACGMYRSRQYEFVHADNSDFILIDAEEDVTILNN